MIEAENWLHFLQHSRDLSLATCGNYRLALKGFGEWLDANGLDPRRAEAADLQKYCGEVLHRRGLAPSTRRIAVSAIRGYYRWLVSKNVLQANPSLALPYPKMGRSLPVPLPAGDAERLMAKPDLKKFKGVRDLAIMAVLIGCGPRVSGVSGLNEGDLIFATNENGLEELTIRVREKGCNERYIPAPDETRLMLRAYLGHPELEPIDRRLPAGGQVLFVNLYNSRVPAHEHRGEARRLTPLSIWKMIQKYGESLGIDAKFLHPHAMRHLYGQELMEGDTNVLVMKQLMGHADLQSTEIYSHVASRKLRKAAMAANPLRRIRSPASGLAAVLRGGLGAG